MTAATWTASRSLDDTGRWNEPHARALPSSRRTSHRCLRRGRPSGNGGDAGSHDDDAAAANVEPHLVQSSLTTHCDSDSDCHSATNGYGRTDIRGDVDSGRPPIHHAGPERAAAEGCLHSRAGGASDPGKPRRG